MTTSAKKQKHQDFIDQVREAGYLDIEQEYHGRNYYVGPALTIDRDDLQNVIRATTMTLAYDDLGKYNYIVYPR